MAKLSVVAKLLLFVMELKYSVVKFHLLKDLKMMLEKLMQVMNVVYQ